MFFYFVYKCKKYTINIDKCNYNTYNDNGGYMRVNNKLYEKQGIHVISAIFTVDNGVTKVLLIKRSNEPYKDMWALLGGSLYNNERLEDGVRREIYEKSGITDCDIYQFKCFDELGDKNNEYRMIVVSYLGILNNKTNINSINKNTLDAKWFDIDNIPKLAFKHDIILEEALEKLKSLIVQSDILKSILKDEFTMPELQNIFESIFKKKFDRRNFRKKILSLDIIDDLNKSISINGNRPSKLYKFKDEIPVRKLF